MERETQVSIVDTIRAQNRETVAAEMERWRNFIQRRDVEVGGSDRQAWDAEKIAAEFGKLGLSSLILVNGGALVAIPPLMQWLNDAAKNHVAPLATWFAVGLLFAGASVVTAYLNFSAMSAAFRSQAARRAHELDAWYTNASLEGHEQHARAARSASRYSTATTATAWIALILAVVSLACFGTGVFGFIDLASRGTVSAMISNPAPQPAGSASVQAGGHVPGTAKPKAKPQ